MSGAKKLLVVVGRFSFLKYPPNNKKEGMLAGVSCFKQITYDDRWIIIKRKTFCDNDIYLSFLSTMVGFKICIFVLEILLCNSFFFSFF